MKYHKSIFKEALKKHRLNQHYQPNIYKLYYQLFSNNIHQTHFFFYKMKIKSKV